MISNIINLNNGYRILEHIDFDGNKKRRLISTSVTQSLTSCEEDKHFDLIDPYLELYDIMPNMADVNKVLMLGGGGFSYPKYFLAKHPNKTIDVVEIENELYQASLEYLYLKEAIELFDKDGSRLHVYIEDAYEYIKKDNMYDAILVDLYIDSEPLHKTFEEETLKRLKSILSKRGYLLINYIRQQGKEEQSREDIKKAMMHFSNIKIIGHQEHFSDSYGNMLIILSDELIRIPNNFSYFEISLDSLLKDNNKRSR